MKGFAVKWAILVALSATVFCKKAAKRSAKNDQTLVVEKGVTAATRRPQMADNGLQQRRRLTYEEEFDMIERRHQERVQRKFRPNAHEPVPARAANGGQRRPMKRPQDIGMRQPARGERIARQVEEYEQPALRRQRPVRGLEARPRRIQRNLPETPRDRKMIRVYHNQEMDEQSLQPLRTRRRRPQMNFVNDDYEEVPRVPRRIRPAGVMQTPQIAKGTGQRRVIRTRNEDRVDPMEEYQERRQRRAPETGPAADRRPRRRQQPAELPRRNEDAVLAEAMRLLQGEQRSIEEDQEEEPREEYFEQEPEDQIQEVIEERRPRGHRTHQRKEVEEPPRGKMIREVQIQQRQESDSLVIPFPEWIRYAEQIVDHSTNDFIFMSPDKVAQQPKVEVANDLVLAVSQLKSSPHKHSPAILKSNKK